jgi:hypothetical protein
MKQYATDLTRQIRQGHPERLLAGKAFCDDALVHSSVNALDVLQGLGFGGAYNGFTHWWEADQRIGAVRRRDGLGSDSAFRVSGARTRWLDGRPIERAMARADARKSMDVAYMPSASRFTDWYAAVGLDYGRFESASGIEDGKRLAWETGVKFQVPTAGLGHLSRWPNRHSRQRPVPLEHPRLVFEFGAGIW